jgi:SAM-dependent methyltransferase
MTMTDPYIFATDAVFEPKAYHRFYSDLGPERTESEVQFMVERLGIDRPYRVLDLACGHGRHANRLAQLGHLVTGIDRSASFLNEARDAAAVMNVTVNYIEADMRALAQKDTYDLALCLFTAFGYFRDEENIAVVNAVSRALVPGGRFVLDVISRDRLVRHLRPLHIVERDGDLMIDRVRFDTKSGRMVNQRTYIVDGERTEAPFSVRTFHLQEMTAIFAAAGLRVELAWGDWKGGELTADSPRLIVVGRKEEES